MNLGKVFRKVRDDNGLNQREMAEKIGMTQAGVWKIESGKNIPRPDTIKSFCKAFGYTTARLYIEALEPSDYE